MADITGIRELAQKLNLWNISRGYIDLNDEKLSNPPPSSNSYLDTLI